MMNANSGGSAGSGSGSGASGSGASLRAILQDLGLQHLWVNFERQRVNVEELRSMGDSDLATLGVSTIGDRHRLRQRCQPRGSILSRFMPRHAPSLRGNPPKKKKRSTPWTCRFVCLADIDTVKTPTPMERQHLKDVGLGELKITFDLNSSPEEFLQTLTDKYPKLSAGGGFQLLTTVSSHKELVPIKGSYSPSNLKERVGQGRIFVRPIQKSLDSEDEKNSDTDACGLTQTCITCNEQFQLNMLREHMEKCSNKEGETDTRGHVQAASTSQQNVCAPNHAAYDAYADLLVDSDGDSLDGDLTEISIAVENSLQDTMHESSSNAAAAVLTLKDVLAEYAIQQPDLVPEEETQLVLVHRRRLLKSIVYAVKKPNFHFEKLVRVQFVGEEGVDIGGPRREMFRLLMQAVVDEMGILEGKADHRYFTHSVDLLEKETFLLAGKLVRWSITQGGPGLPVLDPALYSLMFNESKQGTLTHECIMDYDVREKLNRLATCSEDMFPSVSNTLADWAADRGVTGLYAGNFAQRGEIVSALVKQHTFYRVQSEMLQFKKGLGSLTVAMDEFPTVLKPLFTCEGRERLSRDTIKQLVKTTWSVEGSNLRMLEEDTIYSWEIFLQDCEDGSSRTSLKDVLVFITAADCIPPLGFTKKIDIDFYSPAERQKAYPTASTCALQLHLPRGKGDPSELTALMEEAIINSQGFGKL